MHRYTTVAPFPLLSENPWASGKKQFQSKCHHGSIMEEVDSRTINALPAPHVSLCICTIIYQIREMPVDWYCRTSGHWRKHQMTLLGFISFFWGNTEPVNDWRACTRRWLQHMVNEWNQVGALSLYDVVSLVPGSPTVNTDKESNN